MFYRLTSIILIILGIYYGLNEGAFLDQPTIPHFFESLSNGFGLTFLGVLNFVYLYETPTTPLPKIILLFCNVIYIGFLVWTLRFGIDWFNSAVGVCLLITSILVLNKKV
ncbi:MAG: hypothetical protein P8M34_03005 [Saprospiraceae bacterium]|nr:hypothetical protein [Saprospiraceae bacterium]|tara:strand:+ start:1885 stop:2214 length:330 start_codon:yes stop_codon:yes gene_type:complete